MLRLAIGTAIRDGMTLPAIIEALWREDAAEVTAIFDSIALRDVDGTPGPLDGRHGLLAERMRDLRRPQVWRPKRGLTVSDLAAQAGVDRETMAAALENHGYLELVPYGGRQRRRLLTDRAIAVGFGHNADAAHVRVGHLEGFNRANVFPVIYPEHAADILWTLDLDGIRAKATAMPNKRGRLRWLLAHHGYLPDAFLAELAGYSVRSVERARTEGTGKMSGISYRGHPAGITEGDAAHFSPTACNREGVA
ncbi:hypothetical protein EXY23_07340 [Roseicella aquatilis]|uniref:Uncharacterized protein n=1 Tax=Roseicella aquatilis TaxID=2527868 RepID=A0A4R4DS92_9PROT|nr:hypothetical protein EXY23_07340 [Roseicella aquatilis]